MMFTTAHFTIHMSGHLHHLPHQPCGGKRSFGVHLATATLHAVTDDPLVYIQSDVIHRFHGRASLVFLGQRAAEFSFFTPTVLPLTYTFKLIRSRPVCDQTCSAFLRSY